MSTTCILDALQLCPKVLSRWQLVVVITSLKPLLLETWSSDGWTAEAGVCLSQIVIAFRLISRLLMATTKWIMSVCCGIWLEGTLGVTFMKYGFLQTCFAVLPIYSTLLTDLNIEGMIVRFNISRIHISVHRWWDVTGYSFCHSHSFRPERH